MERREHWDSVYGTKAVNEVSWYEADPQVSLELIEAASPEHRNVIDIGGGASILVDKLLARGFEKVAVLDISPVALGRVKARLGEQAKYVNWIG